MDEDDEMKRDEMREIEKNFAIVDAENIILNASD